MQRYRESFIIICVMILVGGGIYLLQTRGLLPDVAAEAGFSGQSPLQTAVSQLDVIAHDTLDYLNGYLSGSEWGTALPAEAMREEIDQLQYEYEMIELQVNLLYPNGTALDSLLGEFFFGFEVLQGGLTRNQHELLADAQEIFRRLDKEIFHHRQRNI